MDKTLVRGAMLIALTVVLQSLRLFIPLPPMASMFFIGTLVNMMLAVTVRVAGLKPALLAVVLLPFFCIFAGAAANTAFNTGSYRRQRRVCAYLPLGMAPRAYAGAACQNNLYVYVKPCAFKSAGAA